MYDEYTGDVSIPATVSYGSTTYLVTAIGGSAFYGCSSMTSITIPNSVTSIGNFAFTGCTGLSSIKVANDNPYYDSRNNCNAIIETTSNKLIAGCKNTVIPNTVTAIGSYAFSRGGLTSITIPNSVTSIGDGAFNGCSGLTSITIPNSVTTIGDRAFYGCTCLASIDIPNSVTSIGDDAFTGCTGLTSIKVSNGNSKYDSRNNCNAIIESASNTLIAGCQNTIIPNSVTSIGSYSFYGCSGLTSINIPNSVTSIGNGAFLGCSRLASVTIGNSVTTIGHSAFDGCSSLASIDIPNSVTSIGSYSFNGCSGLTSIDIPNSVTSIGNSAFSYSSGLTSIVVSSGNPTYDSRNNCNAIIETASNTLIIGCMNTVIPNSVTSIGNGAFFGCSGLTSVTIPNSVVSIGNLAFADCSSLTSIIIPNSVTSIGDEAFHGCNGLTEIYSLALTPPPIYYYTFTGCYSATLYVPNESVNAYKAADYWKNFTNIVGIGSILPGNTFIVEGIYYRVTNANMVSVIANAEVDVYYTGEVVIPDSVTYEGHTFAVTGIENNAFDGCFELTSITIPNSVADIGVQAFQGCTGLKSVTIGSGVTAIGAKAFNYCNALETVKCLGTVPPVMASADCFTTTAYNRAQLLVPRNTEATYAATDYWYKFAHIDGWGSAGQGDVNGDGVMSITDVTALIDVLLGHEVGSFYYESADLNSNGRIDIGDVTTLIDNLLNGND
jgi:hypothetical protein